MATFFEFLRISERRDPCFETDVARDLDKKCASTHKTAPHTHPIDETNSDKPGLGYYTVRVCGVV